MKIQKGLSPLYLNSYNKTNETHKIRLLRYIAGKNEQAFPNCCSKLGYKIGQFVKSIFGKSDYQITKKLFRNALWKQGWSKKESTQLAKFLLKMAVVENRLLIKNPSSTDKDFDDLVTRASKDYNLTAKQNNEVTSYQLSIGHRQHILYRFV